MQKIKYEIWQKHLKEGDKIPINKEEAAPNLSAQRSQAKPLQIPGDYSQTID